MPPITTPKKKMKTAKQGTRSESAGEGDTASSYAEHHTYENDPDFPSTSNPTESPIDHTYYTASPLLPPNAAVEEEVTVMYVDDSKNEYVYFTPEEVKVKNDPNVTFAFAPNLPKIYDGLQVINDIKLVKDHLEYYLSSVLKTRTSIRDMLTATTPPIVAFEKQIRSLIPHLRNIKDLSITAIMLRNMYMDYIKNIHQMVYLIINGYENSTSFHITSQIINFINNCTDYIVQTIIPSLPEADYSFTLENIDDVNKFISDTQTTLSNLYVLAIIKVANTNTFYKYISANEAVRTYSTVTDVQQFQNLLPSITYKIVEISCELKL